MRVTILLILVAAAAYMLLAYVNNGLLFPWSSLIIGTACGLSALIGDLFGE